MFSQRPTLPTIIPSTSKYKIIFPCNTQAIRAANLLAYDAFGKSNYINEETIKSWLNKNPNLLSVMVDSHFVVRGYFDVLPIKRDTFGSLYKGTISEKEISEQDILGPAENYECLYIGGITSNDRNPIIGSLLLSALLLKLKYIYPSNKYEIGAIAATPEGKHYLELFGFQQSVHAKAADFYCRTIAPGDIDMLINEVGRKTNFLDSQAYRWNAVIESNKILSKVTR